MTSLHLVIGLSVMASNLLAGAYGAWRWWRGEPSVAFWRLLRAGQAVLLVQVLTGGLLLAQGHEPRGELHLLYGLLPLAVSFIGEQLRVASAETVLAQRGLDSAADVRALPEADQRAIVLAIVRREMGVMAVSALVVAGLAIRAGVTAGAL